jgi:L-iditol 2-dehydrogenase
VEERTAVADGTEAGTAAAPVAAVAVAGLSVGYAEEGRAARVLDGVDFALPAGRRLSIVGASGCGKSTLLNVLAGLLPPAAGEVRVGGRRVAAADLDGPGRPGCRTGHAAYMFQKDLLLPWRTVLANATLAAEAARGSEAFGARRRTGRRAVRTATSARARAVLAELGLGDVCDARPDALSGGMRQRVALARTLIAGRGLVLLDEPFGSLDTLTRAETRCWLLEAMRVHPATWVLVTHDVREAVLLGDVVAVLGGRPARLHGWVETGLDEDARTWLARREAGRAGGARARRRRGRGPARGAAAVTEPGGPRAAALAQGGVTMQAVLVRDVGSYGLSEIAVPEPGRDEALVRVSVTGLCRTDLKIVRHGHRDLVLPRVPGEEVVGEIVALGPGGTAAAGAAPHATAFAVGDRVYIYPGVWCGECPSCRRGAENLCRGMRIMGFHRDGGFAELVAVPLQSLIPVPTGLSDEEAVFAEPLSCCLNALELGRVGEGDVLAIWGAGPAGTLLCRAGALRGAMPYVVEPDPRRRDFAAGAPGTPPGAVFAAEPPPQADVAIVAVGDPAAYAQAVAALASRGRLVVFSGLLPDADAAFHLSLNAVHYHEHTVVGAYGCCFRHGEAALRLLASGRLRVDDLVSHRLPLADLEHGLDIVAARAGMKVHLYPGADDAPRRKETR